MSNEQSNDLLQFLLQPERHERNILKLCEEMAELSEVLLKWVNKIPEHRPPVDKIVEEVGDVIFRISVITEQFDIDEQVGERVEEKAEIIHEWYLNKLKEEKNENGTTESKASKRVSTTPY